MITLHVSDSALIDIQKAYDYFETQQTGLGDNLLRRIEDYILFIEVNPTIFKADYKNIRQVRVKPYQYILRYKIYKDKTVLFQMFHGKMHPAKKRK